MKNFIEYSLESGFIMLAFVMAYHVLFKNETDFGFVRKIMLAGLVMAVVIPWFHFELSVDVSLPVLKQDYLTLWLPEIVIGGETQITGSTAIQSTVEVFTFQNVITSIYYAGLVTALLLFLFQLIKLLKVIGRPAIFKNGYRIVELENQDHTFSFFKTIVVGKLDRLTMDDKAQIIRHEKIHADKWHTLDILFIDIIKIIFWFNPIIRLYKNILVQLHEFEADARAVDNSEVDQYCSLMARVALETSGIKVASHFHKSLTLKRIKMIRTDKHKLKWWKLIPTFALISALTFLIACEDQSKPDYAETKDNVPEKALEKFEAFKVSHKGLNFLIANDDKRKVTLETLTEQYGEPVSTEKFSVAVNGKQMEFELFEFNRLPESEAYSVVDDMPEFSGGYEELTSFLQDNIKMPKDLQENGTTYVLFVIEKDGAVSNVEVKKGFNAQADAEAIRVIKAMPAWSPGKIQGEAVRTKFVLPIRFSLK